LHDCRILDLESESVLLDPGLLLDLSPSGDAVAEDLVCLLPDSARPSGAIVSDKIFKSFFGVYPGSIGESIKDSLFMCWH
jgi:hypothetical protein